MFMYISLLVFFVGAIKALQSNTFSFEELKSINYDVDILKTPVKAGETQLLPVIHVTSKYGQQYQCLLPEIEELEKEEKKDQTPEEEIDIKELLKPIQTGSCLLKTKEWWTYEFCYGRYVKQYHIEDGKIIGPEITLGHYESDYDWSNETDQDKFQSSKQRYHSQIYSNGTRCDLTGLPRNTEVRFYCEEDAGDYIFRVDEPGTCSYIMTIHTSRICSHPKLKPYPSSKAHVITCSPILDEKQYSMYLSKLDEEKTAAEKKINKFLSNQHERLKVMRTATKDSSNDDTKIGDDETIMTRSDKVHIKDLGLDDETLTALDQRLLIEDEEEEIAPIMRPTEHDLQREKFTSTLEDMQRQFESEKKTETYDDEELEEEDEDIEPNFDDDTKDISFSKLASTLNMLLEKLDKAEKGVVKAAQELEKMQSAAISSQNEGKSVAINEKASSMYEPVKHEYQRGAKLISGSSVNPQTAVFDDDKLRVRIRRLDRKYSEIGGELNEMDGIQRRKLERAIKEKLEKSGLDTGGRRIEVNIITAGYYDNEDGNDFHSLSDDETNQFQSMIMALLTGQQEALQEMEKQKKLEENYKFVWKGYEVEKAEEE